MMIWAITPSFLRKTPAFSIHTHTLAKRIWQHQPGGTRLLQREVRRVAPRVSGYLLGEPSGAHWVDDIGQETPPTGAVRMYILYNPAFFVLARNIHST